MRRGITVVEVLVALGIGAVVIGCLMGLWTLGSKMHQASQSTVALQAALTMTESLFADLRQIGLQAGLAQHAIGPAGRPAGVPGNTLSFYKVSFKADRIALVPVRYRTVASPGGNRLLVRDEKRGGTLVSHVFQPCPVQYVEFEAHADAFGNEFIRAAVNVLEDDRPPGTVTIAPERIVRQQVMIRVPVPDRFGDAQYDRVNVVTRDADLLPP